MYLGGDCVANRMVDRDLYQGIIVTGNLQRKIMDTEETKAWNAASDEAFHNLEKQMKRKDTIDFFKVLAVVTGMSLLCAIGVFGISIGSVYVFNWIISWLIGGVPWWCFPSVVSLIVFIGCMFGGLDFITMYGWLPRWRKWRNRNT